MVAEECDASDHKRSQTDFKSDDGQHRQFLYSCTSMPTNKKDPPKAGIKAPVVSKSIGPNRIRLILFTIAPVYFQVQGIATQILGNWFYDKVSLLAPPQSGSV